MDWLKIKDGFGWIGDKSGIATQKTISWISSLGVKITDFQSKILDILLIAVLIYLALKLMTSFKTIVKFGIIILLGILGISIIISFF